MVVIAALGFALMAADSFTVPIQTNAQTLRLDARAQYRQRQQGFTAIFVDAYDRHGSHNPTWDKQAHDYLKMVVNDSIQVPALIVRNDRRIALGKTLRSAGCDDPLITFMIAQDEWIYGDRDEARAIGASVYPSISKHGYDGIMRAVIGRSIAFGNRYLTQEERQALVATESAGRLEWLTNQDVQVWPGYLMENFWRTDPDGSFDNVHRNGRVVERTYIPHDQAAFSCIADAEIRLPDSQRWLGCLVKGIAETMLSGVQGDFLRTYEVDNAARGPGRAIDQKHLAAARLLLEEASRLHPKDVQAECWLLKLDLADPRADVGARVANILSRDVSYAPQVMGVAGLWLERYRSGDADAIRTLALSCVADGYLRSELSDEYKNVLLRSVSKHIGNADFTSQLLRSPEVYRALMDWRYYRSQFWMRQDEDYRNGTAQVGILLELMGYRVESHELYAKADESFRDYLARTFLGMSGQDLWRRQEADPAVVAYAKAMSLTNQEGEAIAKALKPLLRLDEPFVSRWYAFMLCQNEATFTEGRRLLETIAETYGHQDWDGLMAYAALQAKDPSLHAFAIDLLREDPGRLLRCDRIFGILNMGRVQGLQRELIALIPDQNLCKNTTLDDGLARMLMDVGDPERVAQIYVNLRKHRVQFRDDLAPDIAAIQTLAARIAKRPDLEFPVHELAKLGAQGKGDQAAKSACAFLAGDISREMAISQSAAQSEYPKVIHYYLMYAALAAGQDDLARKDWEVLQTEPGWVETHALRGFAQSRGWLAQDDGRPAGGGDF